MRKEIADKLSAALTSGEYEQTKGALRTETGYCCLGVLCELYRQEVNPQAEWSQDRTLGGDIHHLFLYENAVLPLPVQAWAGMKTYNGGFDRDPKDGYLRQCLSGMNDEGATFEEIAKVIQEHYEEL